MKAKVSRVYPLSALLLGVLLLSLLVFFIHRLSTPDVALAVHDVDMVYGEHGLDELGDKVWERVTLPHDWHADHEDVNAAWYRVKLDLNVAPERLWGVYLPNVHMNAQVYLNNKLLGVGGRLNEPVSRNFNRPLYFSIANGSLNVGENILYLHVKSENKRAGFLPSVYLGPAEFVKPVYNARYFFRYTVSLLIVIAMFVAGGFMAMLWWRRRSDTVYGWFSLSVMVWAVFNLSFVIVDIPINGLLWDKLSFVAMIWLPVVITFFVTRFLGEKNDNIERGLYLYGSFSTFIIFLLGENSLYFAAENIFATFSILLGAYPVYRLFLHGWDRPSVEVFLLMLSGGVVMVFCIHDFLVINHILSKEEGVFTHYSAPVALLVFGYILVTRFAKSLSLYETLNVELEDRVKRKHQELEENFQKLRSLEHQKVLSDERERIMRDMHDGMGGHIVSTLALIEQGKTDLNSVRGALKLALDDLRLMIDSMDECEGDLLAVLGMLRMRLEPRLAQVGIEMDWRVEDVPEIPNFGPEKSLQVMRIVQEAITNVIKHAQASRLTISTGYRVTAEGKMSVCVDCIDDGKGLSNLVKPHGRGLQNIKKRAQMVGWNAEIARNEDRGTRVSIWLPLTA